METTEQLQKRLSEIRSQEKEILKQIEDQKKKQRSIIDKISDYSDIIRLSKVSDKADNLNVEGFNDDENKVVKAFIKKMRIAKIYNEGWLPKRGDRRYYPWYDVSSGFGFRNAYCDTTTAHSASAARLSFKSEELTKDYDKKFRSIEKDLIDLQ